MLFALKPSEPDPFTIVGVIFCQVWLGIFIFLEIVNPTLENEPLLIKTVVFKVALMNKEFSEIIQSLLLIAVPPETFEDVAEELYVMVKAESLGITKTTWPIDDPNPNSETFTIKSFDTPADEKTTSSISIVGEKSGAGTVTDTVAVSQFVGLLISQIV